MISKAIILLGLLFYRLDHPQATIGLVVDADFRPRSSFGFLLDPGETVPPPPVSREQARKFFARMSCVSEEGRWCDEVTTDVDGRFATDMPGFDRIMIIEMADDDGPGQVVTLFRPARVILLHPTPVPRYGMCGNEVCEELPAFPSSTRK
jgi:hypothetical protein